MHTRLRPDRETGRDRHCTGVGLWEPAWVMAALRGRLRPRVEKEPPETAFSYFFTMLPEKDFNAL